MKLFIKNTIIFLAILYGSIFMLVFISNYIVSLKADFKLQPNINKIVMGNSHPAGTYNDSLISNFKNLSDPGENYFYGYQKLKEILKQNTQLDTVFIEFYPKTILAWEDSKLWKKHQIPIYLAFFNLKDHYVLAKDNSIGYQQELLKSIHSNLNRIIRNKYNYIEFIGGYRHVDSSRVQDLLKTVNYDPEKQFKLTEKKLSKHDLTYLKKMIELCENKNVQAVFVRSPYHEKFDGRRFENIFQTYRIEHFKDIPFLDFKDFPIDDSEFKDLEHLNYKGARKFSIWFENQKDFKPIF